jgi:hypothetical protein
MNQYGNRDIYDYVLEGITLPNPVAGMRVAISCKENRFGPWAGDSSSWVRSQVRRGEGVLHEVIPGNKDMAWFVKTNYGYGAYFLDELTELNGEGIS